MIRVKSGGRGIVGVSLDHSRFTEEGFLFS